MLQRIDQERKLMLELINCDEEIDLVQLCHFIKSLFQMTMSVQRFPSKFLVTLSTLKPISKGNTLDNFFHLG
jgi:hypothetical protein